MPYKQVLDSVADEKYRKFKDAKSHLEQVYTNLAMSEDDILAAAKGDATSGLVSGDYYSGSYEAQAIRWDSQHAALISGFTSFMTALSGRINAAGILKSQYDKDRWKMVYYEEEEEEGEEDDG